MRFGSHTSQFFAVTAFVLILPLLAAAQKPIHLEAEEAKLEGPTLHRVTPDAKTADAALNFSGMGYVSGLEASEDRVEFNFSIKAAGIYTLAMGYRSSGKKGFQLDVDGLAIDGSLEATESGRFEQKTLARVELVGGKNTVVVHKGWGYYDIDYLELRPAQPIPVPAASSPASDTQLTPEAQALLGSLKAAYGKTTMLGVYNQKDSDYALDKTGIRPAIMGGDLLAYSPSEVAHGSHPEKADEVGRMIAASKAGYTVTLSWHWCSPTGLMDTKEKPWWRGFYTDSTNFDVKTALADPSSSDYAAMLSDIDAIAVQLRKLQDAHVPVLWRPLHEAGGGWFWWGAKGPVPFVQLWRLLFDRLTKVDGIHNLVWVFTGDADMAWYPGDSYVDIVGIDAYPRDLHDPQTQLWDALVHNLGSRKLLAVSEFGGVPDVPRMQRMGEWWSYAVSWSGDLGPRKNDVDDLKRIYLDKGTQPPAAPAEPQTPPVGTPAAPPEAPAPPTIP